MGEKKKFLTCAGDLTKLLAENNQLWILEDLVDPDMELAQIQREVCLRKGPAVLFTKVKGSRFPVVSNLYGSPERLKLAFGDIPKKFIEQLADLAMNFHPPFLPKLWGAGKLVRQVMKAGLKRKKKGPVLQNQIIPPDLNKLPLIKSWPEDGGAFITLPLVYTESPVSGKGNLGMYRVQRHGPSRAGMHIQIHRGGGFHYYEAEKMNSSLPVRIFVGGPPALTLAAIAPLPEDVPELLFASLLAGRKIPVGHPDDLGISAVLNADFSIQGRIPPFLREPEGPFGDHYGYYSLRHDYPYVEVESIYHRKDAVFPVTVVGRPPQEDHYITEFLQEILEPLFPLVMPQVKKVWAYEESGVHSLAGAIVANRYYKEAFNASLRILSEGQLSLSKILAVTDQDCDVRDFKALLVKVLERADLERDLYIFSNISQDTLDYTGPRVNKGSKAILLGIGEKKNDLPTEWRGSTRHPALGEAAVFCPGALCLKGAPYQFKKDLPNEILSEPDLREWKLVFLMDSPKEAVRSTSDFIWHVFTRFEPAADIYGKINVERLHLGFSGPVVIDCRMKPWYPSPLEEDPQTAKKVNDKWGKTIDKVCGGKGFA